MTEQDSGALGRSERVFEGRNPISGEIAYRASATSVDREAIIVASHAAFSGRSKLGPEDRRMLLPRADNVLPPGSEELMSVTLSQIGAPIVWRIFSARLSVGMLSEAAAPATQIDGKILPSDAARGVTGKWNGEVSDIAKQYDHAPRPNWLIDERGLGAIDVADVDLAGSAQVQNNILALSADDGVVCVLTEPWCVPSSTGSMASA